MTDAGDLINLVDELQGRLDDYIQDREFLLQDYNSLLDENEALKDTIAELTEKADGSKRN